MLANVVLTGPVRTRFARVYWVGFAESSGCSLDLIAHDFAQQPFEGFIFVLDVFPKCGIEHCLIVSSALVLDLGFKPVNDISVEAYCYPHFALIRGQNRPPSAFLEIIFWFHIEQGGRGPQPKGWTYGRSPRPPCR